jgi:hypothetical protein
MRLGIVLPSFWYSDERKRLAKEAFQSLSQTEELYGHETRILVLIKGQVADYTDFVSGLTRKFGLILKTDEGLTGTEQTLAFGTQYMIDNFECDHLMWMGDDALFHPMWLWKLEGLIKRHPGAKSWSVYRSAYEWFHRTLDDSGEDVLVRSICGHGMTFTAQEWKEWGVDWKTVSTDPNAHTLDLTHYDQRPGDRWVTKKSFVQHTGKVGVHCDENTPEFARNFQLVGE